MKPLEYPHLKYVEMYSAQNKTKKKMRHQNKYSREEKSWHSISQEENVGGMCCRFCYWRCTPGERSETDWHHLFPVNCFLDPPSFFRYRKKEKENCFSRQKTFWENKLSTVFLPWPVNFGLLRDHMSISAHRYREHDEVYIVTSFRTMKRRILHCC